MRNLYDLSEEAVLLWTAGLDQPHPMSAKDQEALARVIRIYLERASNDARAQAVQIIEQHVGVGMDRAIASIKIQGTQ